MATVTLTGHGDISTAGRGSLGRALTGSSRISVGGNAALKLSQVLAGAGAVATGGRINTGLVSALTAKAISISDRLANVSSTVLTDSLNRQWREELSESGSFQFDLMNDNTLTTSITWLPNELVDFYIGSSLAWTGLVESYEAVDIDESNEERAQLTTYRGRGHVALLDRIVIYPALGPYMKPIEEDRPFNWSSPAYDDTSWGTATVLGLVLDALTDAAGEGFAGIDTGLPDDYVRLLGPAGGTFDFAPIGDCYFREEFTIATSGTYLLYFYCDDEGEFYLDGQLISTITGINWLGVTSNTVDITAGTHLAAAHVANLDPGFADNPLKYGWSLWSINSQGRAGSLVWSAAEYTKSNEYPASPPGMTPGQAIIVCLDEALARDADPLYQAIRDNLSFDEARDSNGTYWPTFADMATKVGTSLFAFLRELAGTYIDFSMTPGTFELNAYVIGGRSTGRTASFYAPTSTTDPATGNLLRLKRTGES